MCTLEHQEELLHYEVSTLKHKIKHSVDTDFVFDTKHLQLQVLSLFMGHLGYDIVFNNGVWHVVRADDSANPKYMKLDMAVSLYVSGLVWRRGSYYTSMDGKFIFSIEQVKSAQSKALLNRIHIQRKKGAEEGFICTNNLVSFI
jgi:hypothetical protein